MTQVSPQHTNTQAAWVKTIRWSLLFVAGTILGTLFVFVVPYALLVADFLLYNTLFWLQDRSPDSISFLPTRLTITSGLLAGTYEFDVWVLGIIVTGIYLGIIVALLGSGNKKQALVGVGLAIIYLSGTGYVFLRTMFAILS